MSRSSRGSWSTWVQRCRHSDFARSWRAWCSAEVDAARDCWRDSNSASRAAALLRCFCNKVCVLSVFRQLLFSEVMKFWDLTAARGRGVSVVSPS
jgi:hypothetical protein